MRLERSINATTESACCVPRLASPASSIECTREQD